MTRRLPAAYLDANVNHPFTGFTPPGRVYGVVLNDLDSLQALAPAFADAPYKAPPKAPVMYIKPANTLAPSGATVTLPPGARRVQVGATLGVVLAAPAARLRADDAMAAVAGWRAVADLSLPHDSYYRPAIREKCFDGSCVLAATVAPAGALRPDALRVQTFINGAQVDEWPLSRLARGIPELLRDVTAFMTLSPGDLLLAGVRWQAPVAQAGDQVAVRIHGVGELSFSLALQEGKA